MDTVLVTGGAGFIGSNFVRLLLSSTRSNVVVVDKLTYAGSRLTLEKHERDPRFKFIEADIADVSAMKSAFAEHKPGWVVNFAAETHVDRSIDSPADFIHTNVMGTFVLLEQALALYRAASDAAKKSFRFLHVSTDEVYGTLGPTGVFTEETPYAPRSPYSASKAGADHLVSAYFHTYGLPALITNCSNNYGPYQFPEKLIPLMILNALEGKKLPIYGDGGNIRDWLYVEDHCEAILIALKQGRPGEKYNIGGGNERTNLQIIDRLCAVLEELHPSAKNPALSRAGAGRYFDLKSFVPDRPGHDRRYAIDATKFRQETGWAPKHPFDDGIRRTVQWYLENRGWCEAVQRGRYGRERLGLSGGAA